MPSAAKPKSFAEQGRVALSVRLPALLHRRMRAIALERGERVNDLYQSALARFVADRLPDEPFLRGPPTSATQITLWLEPSFHRQLKAELDRREQFASNVVLTTVLEEYGADLQLTDAVR